MPTEDIQGVLLDEGGWAINVRTLGIQPGTPQAPGTITAEQIEALEPGQYLLPAGTYTVGPENVGTVTVPAGVSLHFARGAVLQPLEGVLLVLDEAPQAGRFPIFDGSEGGRVMLSRAARTGDWLIDWWGADASGNWDDALHRAMFAVGTTEPGTTEERGRGGVIHFGRGVYRFALPGTFSQFSYLGIKRGFTFRGTGPQSTLLYLLCGGAQKWFYDTTDKHGRWTFHDLGFSSDDRSRGCGFRHTTQAQTAGEEKEFRYYNCFFGDVAHAAFGSEVAAAAGMSTGFSYHGIANADLNKWFGCRFGGFAGGLLHFDNNQSVSHAMYGCDAELTGTFATTHAHGGGDLKVYGGTLVMKRETAGGDPYYVLDHQDSAELWAGNSTFVFDGVRFEFHGAARMVRKRHQTAGMGVTNTVFRSCDIYVAGSPRPGVEIVQNALVLFDRTNVPALFRYQATPNAGVTGLSGTGGIILFRACDVPPDLYDLSDVGAFTGGRVIAEGCYHHLRAQEGTPPLGRAALDFDKGWENALAYDRLVTRKLAVLKQKVAPLPRAGNQDESTVLLPPGAVICGIRVFKPAHGADPGTYRLLVGTGDRGTVHGYSATAAAGLKISDQHRILKSDLSFQCGTDATSRTVRLWMEGTATEVQTNLGYALVEYL